MIKISVIIPVYNVDKYLRQCLDSIVNQTLKEIEIICVNDGSTDNSLEILNEYAKKDERFVIVTQKNHGAGSARNTGLKIANGEYILMLDSDDYFDSGMFEKIYEKAKKSDTDILICKYKEYNEISDKYKDCANSVQKDMLPEKKVFNYKDIPQYIIGFCMGWAWDKLYKSDFIKKYNLQYPNIQNSEDAAFVFSSLVLADKISVIDDKFIVHRKRSDSLENNRYKAPLCFVDSAMEIKRKLEQYNRYDDVEQSFLNWFVDHSLWHYDTSDVMARELIRERLQNEIFGDFEVMEKPKSYFYKQKNYKRIHNKNFENSNFLQNIFSIKNKIEGNKKYKVITILGISIIKEISMGESKNEGKMCIYSSIYVSIL